MPIEVRHGEPDIGALVALAAIMGAGQQRAPEIPRIQIGGVPGGGGGGGRGTRHERVPWHRRIWGGPVTRRAAPTIEEQLQYEGEKMQLQEKAEAEGWERKYSAKARQDIARIEKARQDLRANPAFSEREKMVGERALIAQSMGIEKDVIPPDPDKEVFELGKGPRDMWRNPETGDYVGLDRNGSPVVRIKYADTPEGRQETHQQAMELEKLKHQTKIEDLRRAQEITWAETPVPVMQEAIEGKWYGGAQEAGQVGERFRTREEVEALSQRYFGPRSGQEAMRAMDQLQPRAEQEFTGLGQQQGQFAEPRELVEATRIMQERGILIPRKSDADLPYYVGMAKSFMRKMKSESERGRDISRYLEAGRQATIILQQYDAGEIYGNR